MLGTEREVREECDREREEEEEVRHIYIYIYVYYIYIYACVLRFVLLLFQCVW